MNEIYIAALRSGLSPLLARIAAIVAEVEGQARARAFINEVLAEDELGAMRRSERPPRIEETILPFTSGAAPELDPPAPAAGPWAV